MTKKHYVPLAEALRADLAICRLSGPIAVAAFTLMLGTVSHALWAENPNFSASLFHAAVFA